MKNNCITSSYFYVILCDQKGVLTISLIKYQFRPYLDELIDVVMHFLKKIFTFIPKYQYRSNEMTQKFFEGYIFL